MKKTLNNPSNVKPNTKEGENKDIAKVLDFFRYKTGTTLDAMIHTGILRNSITWYVDDLIKMDLLFVAYRMQDKHTKRMANHYSADPLYKNKVDRRQLTLFDLDAISTKGGAL